MLKVITVLLLIYLSRGHTASVTPNTDVTTKSQNITTTSTNNEEPDSGTNSDMSKDLMTSGSDNDQDDMKVDEETMVTEAVEMPDIMTIMNECNISFRIEMSYLESLNTSGSFPDETDKTPKCYVRCLLENTGIASVDGQYDPELTSMIFAGQRGGKPMDGLEDIATNCADERKESCKCERAYQYIKCVMETEIKKYAQ